MLTDDGERITPVLPQKEPPHSSEEGSRENVQPKLPRHPIVEIVDHLVEISAICWGGYGWIVGRSSWVEFFTLVCTVLGVQGVARGMLAKLKPNTNISAGVVGILLLTLTAVSQAKDKI